jgi:hypothetical protein
VRALAFTETTAGLATPQARYFVVRNEDSWVIKYETEEFGPYKSHGGDSYPPGI